MRNITSSTEVDTVISAVSPPWNGDKSEISFFNISNSRESTSEENGFYFGVCHSLAELAIVHPTNVLSGP